MNKVHFLPYSFHFGSLLPSQNQEMIQACFNMNIVRLIYLVKLKVIINKNKIIIKIL